MQYHRDPHGVAEGTRSDRELRAQGGYASQRWARVVLFVVEADDDLRTMEDWARHAGVSLGTLRGWCRIARVSPKHSLDFARLLRVVQRGEGSPARAFEVLNVVDHRTMTRLLRDGGLGTPAGDDWPSVAEFLQRQNLVRNAHCLASVEVLCRLRGIKVDGRD
jgi:hypothetical protein